MEAGRGCQVLNIGAGFDTTYWHLKSQVCYFVEAELPIWIVEKSTRHRHLPVFTVTTQYTVGPTCGGWTDWFSVATCACLLCAFSAEVSTKEASVRSQLCTLYLEGVNYSLYHSKAHFI
jgi:hypothetical protein